MVPMDNENSVPYSVHQGTRVMVFVDGENLACRYATELGDQSAQDHVKYRKDTFVWSRFANMKYHQRCEVLRHYYYTTVQGDDLAIDGVVGELKAVGIEAPRVFKKRRGRSAKRVDISLATDMLSHAHRKNYDLAILVAGDEDYVPLVEAVMAEGRRVVVWALRSGLSPALATAVDHCFNVGSILFATQQELVGRFR